MNGLRDIHEPLPPDWWPPAPAWWLLTLVLVGVLVSIFRRVRDHYRRAAPYRAARTRFAALDERRAAGTVDTRAFVDGANALLKSLLVDTEHRVDAVRANGDAWLALLRERCGDAAFTSAPGRLLGNDRFRRALTDDATELAALLRGALDRLRPPSQGRPGA